MQEIFDVRQGLRVFHKVRSHGEANGHEHILNGIGVSTDFDGYTLHLHDSAVDAFIYFHNTFKVDSPSTAAMKNFLLRMQRIDDTDYDVKV